MKFTCILSFRAFWILFVVLSGTLGIMALCFLWNTLQSSPVMYIEEQRNPSENFSLIAINVRNVFSKPMKLP